MAEANGQLVANALNDHRRITAAGCSDDAAGESQAQKVGVGDRAGYIISGEHALQRRCVDLRVVFTMVVLLYPGLCGLSQLVKSASVNSNPARQNSWQHTAGVKVGGCAINFLS